MKTEYVSENVKKKLRTMEDVIVVSVFHCPAYHAERHYSTVFWRSDLEKKHEEFLCEKPSALNGEQFLSE